MADFNPCIYKNLYDDLRQMSDFDATLHYIRCGRYENRKIKSDIDTDNNLAKYHQLNDIQNNFIITENLMDTNTFTDINIINSQYHDINLILNYCKEVYIFMLLII